MTIEIVRGCLLNAFDKGEVNVIGHVVNCQHKMASGIAKSIREHYPVVYEEYMDNPCVLGNCGFVDIEPLVNPLYPEKTVCNLYAQCYYGYDGKRYLNYAALSEALREMADGIPSKLIVGFPYKMGSDRAGGDFEIVLEMIEFYFKDHNVRIYKL